MYNPQVKECPEASIVNIPVQAKSGSDLDPGHFYYEAEVVPVQPSWRWVLNKLLPTPHNFD